MILKWICVSFVILVGGIGMAAIVGGIIGAILVVLVIVLIVVYLRKKKDRTDATLFPPERAVAMRVMSDPYSIDPASIKVLYDAHMRFVEFVSCS